MIPDWYSGNTEGILTLRASASAQPSRDAWEEIAVFLKGLQENPGSPVVVLDLRQESHGYLNGEAITLTDQYNWLNLEKTREEGKTAERNWLMDLSSRVAVDQVLSVRQFRRKEYAAGLSIPVETVNPEAEYVNARNWWYYRLPVTDHRAPEDTVVDEFVAFIDTLPANTWLHVHCRGGKGRTTTFLALYDMLLNADKASFTDIIERQASIPPFYDLSQTTRENPELGIWYYERLRFLQSFYVFAKDRFSGFDGSWSVWKRTHRDVGGLFRQTE